MKVLNLRWYEWTVEELIKHLQQYPKDAFIGMNQDDVWEVHSKEDLEFLGYVFD